MYVRTWQLALEQAKANAKRTGQDHIVFFSTDNRPQCEPYNTQAPSGAVIVKPNGLIRDLTR